MTTQEELRKQYEKQISGKTNIPVNTDDNIKHDPQAELRKQYEEQTSGKINVSNAPKQEDSGISIKSVLSGITDAMPIVSQYKKGIDSASQLSENINPNNEYISALKQSIIKSNPILDTYSKAPELFSQDVNANSGDISDSFQSSIKDSLIGIISDTQAGKKGGSGYKMHDKSWSMDAFGDPQKAKDVLNDLTYLTGTMVEQELWLPTFLLYLDYQ